MEANTILCGDVLAQLGQLADQSVNCVVTSPPYWGLRDYGTAKWIGGSCECDHMDIKKGTTRGGANSTLTGGQNMTPHKQQYRHRCAKCGAIRQDDQIGNEDTPEEYIAKMVEVFRELWRVLRDDGTVWLNLGDSYAGSSNKSGEGEKRNLKTERFHGGSAHLQQRRTTGNHNLKPKDLVGIPWRVALALQADGWYLRSDIIWHKPNCLPESVKDRPTKAHEYVFLLTKAARYWYDADAIREPNSDPTRTNFTHGHKMDEPRNDRGGDDFGGGTNGRNKRTVWTIPTRPYKAAHFATFPEELAATCIKAGCPAQVCVECGEPWVRVVEKERTPTRPGLISSSDHTADHFTKKGSGGNTELRYRFETKVTTIGFAPTCQCCPLPGMHIDKWGDHWPIFTTTRPGVVLDPFFGAGTVGVVAKKLQRGWLGIELNPEYAAMAQDRIDLVQPPLPIVALAAEVAEDNGAEQLKLL